ncbi:hypothetical protein PIB30_028936 [Stylosanthes scabra]|uniref:Uncharacterized protein n=1 Tax=Stylosanthes scabra TaxID=79078 RepID=A0ABU6SCL5_9FABA|nr:hypothetical protein [Stylosanthes scabra]
MERPGSSHNRRAHHRVSGKQRLRLVGRTGLRALHGLTDGHMEVPQRRHQHRIVPRPLRRLHPEALPSLLIRLAPPRGNRGVHPCPLLPQLHRSHHRGIRCRFVGSDFPLPLRSVISHRHSQDSTSQVAQFGAEGSLKRLEFILQHTLLESQLLG